MTAQLSDHAKLVEASLELSVRAGVDVQLSELSGHEEHEAQDTREDDANNDEKRALDADGG